MYGAFSSREVAAGIWLLAGFVFALTNEKTRSSLVGVLKALFRAKILVVLASMVAYTGATVVGLSEIGFWKTFLLKDTILWFCLSGVAMVMTHVTAGTSECIFRRIARDSVQVVLVLEFLVNAYTFPLWVELLLMPFMTLVVAVDTLARTREEYTPVLPITSGLQTVVGLSILVAAIRKAVTDHANFLGLDALRELLLGPVLSLLFTPFIYLTLLLAGYEQVFLMVNLGPEKTACLRRYARRRLIAYAQLSLRRVNDLRRRPLELIHIQSREDVDKLTRPSAVGMTPSSERT